MVSQNSGQRSGPNSDPNSVPEKSLEKSQWDLGRFIKTLSYYGAVPLLSNFDWFQHWLGSRPAPKVDSRSMVAGHLRTSEVTHLEQPSQRIWVWDDWEQQTHLSQQILRNLNEQGYDADQLLPESSLSSAKALICCADLPTTQLSDLLNRSSINSVNLVRRPIFDFAQPASDLVDWREIWGALDDVVMGGVSESGIRFGDGVAYFSGNVSTANSGGFASVRTRNLDPALDLSRFEGVELRVKGDGQRYKFMLRTETRWDGIAYCFSFDTLADQWLTVQIPFTELIPVFRARTLPNRPIDSSHITAWQLMLSKFEYDGALNPHFQPGCFQLQVASIQVYRQAKPDDGQTRLVLINPGPSMAHAIQTSSLPYTIIYPSSLINQPCDQRLQVSSQPLTGEVSAEAVARLSIAALQHPDAQNRTLHVTAGDSSCEVGDWDCLLSQLRSRSN
jgi:hypothetical protein